MTSSSKQKQRDLVKAAILFSVEQTVLTEGWQAVSIRKIADAIGYSLPVVYNHFESKEAIQSEFVRKGFKLLTHTVSIIDEPKAKERLVAIALAYFNFGFSNIAYYRLMFGLGIPSCERSKEIEEIASFSNILIDALKQLIIIPNKDHLTLKFHCFWSILHGLTAINMVNLSAAPNNLQEQILLDAVQGFIKNINN